MTIQTILDEVSHEISNVPGVVGVVLGGSRARGTHHETSDIDIGIYYDEATGFDVKAVEKIAQQLDDKHRENLVSSLGEWGPWINGGGWLGVEGYHVDLIFGTFTGSHKLLMIVYQAMFHRTIHTGHPHAFLNVMYMGEIAICEFLTDPEKQIADLKAKTMPYPRH
nr:nucleotidyltransferase domain-containing protein [Lentibacillus sp. CBA3610]